MSTTARSRINADLKRQAEAVLAEIGLTPRTALEMFYSQLVKLRALPFRPSEFPALEDYGATLDQADAAEAATIAEFQRDRKAGKTFVFKGKL